ncbi:hypothetical protein [Blastopirellula marina]|nr:hypothetical protein [Blastopirellula marina]
MNSHDPLINWDRQRIAAICVAILSVLLTGMATFDAEILFRQCFGLLLPLSIIFWPEVMDQAFSRSKLRSHGGEPAPGIMLQIVAWIALLLLGYWRFAVSWLAMNS